MIKVLYAVTTAVILAGTAALGQSGQYSGRTAIGADFDTLTVRNSDGDRLTIHMRIDEEGGYYVLCMATSGRENEDNEELMENQLILLNGEIIMRGTAWAPHFRNANGRNAVCQRTGARVVSNPNFTTEWQEYDF